MSSVFNTDVVLKIDKYYFTLPVPPINDLTFVKEGLHQTERTINHGEVSVRGGKGLKRFTLYSLLPSETYYKINKGWTRYDHFSNPYLPNRMSTGTTDRQGAVVFNSIFLEMVNKAIDESIPVEMKCGQNKDLNGTFLIKRFSHTYKGGESAIRYAFDFEEYVKPEIVVVRVEKKENAVAQKEPSRKPSINSFAVGDIVKCSGNYYYDSYGSKPSYTFKSGFIGKVDRVITNKGRPMPIHIKTQKGGWVGWVKPEQLEIA